MKLDINALINAKILLEQGGGGGGAGITKIAEKEFTVSTTSTSETDVGYVPVDEAYWTGDKILLITALDKAGNRADHFFGSITAFVNHYAKNGSTTSITSLPVYRVYSNEYSKYSGSASQYGIYAKKITKNDGVLIVSKYNESSSKAIDGTFKVTVYQLDIPFLA